MSKWVLNTFQGIKIWYSNDVIERIKKIAKDIVKNDVYENSDAKASEILKIIENEDK